MPRKRIAKCGKRADPRPARPRYWASGRLALKKIRNLVRSGYTVQRAFKTWAAARKRYAGALPTLAACERFCRPKCGGSGKR